MKNILIAVSGTGGHVYPGIALAYELKKFGYNPVFVVNSNKNGVSLNIVKNSGYDYKILDFKAPPRKMSLQMLCFPFKFIKVLFEAKSIIKQTKPCVAIGMGAYLSFPMLLVAKLKSIPTLIHEQNSIPGLSNKFISSFSNCICVSLPNSLNLFPKEKVVYTGNPRSEEILGAKPLSREESGFDKDKKLVIVVMGSLGSVTMTEKIKELIPSFNNKDYQVLIITGKNYYDEYKEIPTSDNVKVVPFMDNLINLMKDADLMVSRAGASTIAEITAIGLPAILVPSPYVTNNHQYKNAKELEDHGACVIVTEEDFSSKTIIQEVERLLDDEKRYKEMSEHSRELGIDDSATRIYQEIKKLVG